VAGIAEAFVDQPSAGFVNLYVLTDESDPENRIPTAAKRAEAEDYVSDSQRKPLNAQVSVVAWTELSFDVEITGLLPDTTETQTAVQNAIESHLYSRRPRQYDDEPDPRDVVSAARLTSAAIDAGAESLSLVLRNPSGTAISEYTLQINELATPGTVTFS
jgi:hypothetical protein